MYRLLKRPIVLLPAAAAAVLGAALIAAGALSGDDQPVAKMIAASPARASGSDTTAYEKCLNDHGWPVGPGLSIDPNGSAPPPEAVDAAVAACADLEQGALEALRPSDEQLQELTNRANRFAACMRDHGFGIGEPNVFRSRAGIGVSFPRYAPSAPGFDAAYSACRSIMNVYG